MVNYQNNPLYGIKSKKKILKLLFIEKEQLKNLINDYNVYIRNGKRIIESCNPNLKDVHKRIFKFLKKLELPNYLISSKKGYSYYKNYEPHKDNNYFCMLDIEKFFPKCSSFYVYQLFLKKFNMSKDVAYLITEICTIDKNKVFLNNKVLKWYTTVESKINFEIPNRHIPTGSPISQILAFLSFEDMFEEINQYCLKNTLTFTVFVDDITLSSKTKISKKHIYEIKKILRNYNHNNNINKNRFRIKNDNKRITGVILDKYNNPHAQMKIHYKFKEQLNLYKNNHDLKVKNKLLGYINTIDLIENKKYENVKKAIKNGKV